MSASKCSRVSAIAEHPEKLPNPVIFKSLSKSPEHERPERSCLSLSAGCVQPSGRQKGKKMNNTKSKSSSCQWRVVQNKTFKGERYSFLKHNEFSLSLKIHPKTYFMTTFDRQWSEYLMYRDISHPPKALKYSLRNWCHKQVAPLLWWLLPLTA